MTSKEVEAVLLKISEPQVSILNHLTFIIFSFDDAFSYISQPFSGLTVLCNSCWLIQKKKRDGNDDTNGIKKHKKSKVMKLVLFP